MMQSDDYLEKESCLIKYITINGTERIDRELTVEKDTLNTANVVERFSWDASELGKLKVIREYWDSLPHDFHKYVNERLIQEKINLELIPQVEWSKHKHTEYQWFIDIFREMRNTCDFDKIQKEYHVKKEKNSEAFIPFSYDHAKVIDIHSFKKELKDAATTFLNWDQRVQRSIEVQLHKLDELLEEYSSLLKLAQYIDARLPRDGIYNTGQYFIKLGSCSTKDGIKLECKSGKDIIKSLISSRRCLFREFTTENTIKLIVQPFNPYITRDNRKYEFRLFIWNSRVTAISQQVWHTVFNYDEACIKEIIEAVEKLNKSENFIRSACSIDVYLYKGQLHIIEYNEPEVSAAALYDYNEDYDLLYGKNLGFQLRLLIETLKPASEKIQASNVNLVTNFGLFTNKEDKGQEPYVSSRFKK